MLSHGYVTTTALPTTSTTASTVGGSVSTRRSAGKNEQANKAPVLFDFRTTDRSPSSTRKADPAAGSGMSLLSQGLKDGPSPSAIPTSSSPSTRQPFPPPVASNNAAASGILRRTSTSGGKSGLYSPMPAPRMRPRALSMQMKIKGEILPDGASDDEDEEDEGMVVDGDESGERGKAVPLGTGSGGIKGKRKGMVFRCESCAKVYRHPSCLSKHRWEHSPHWANSSKLLLSKHQQVQLLEVSRDPVVRSSGLLPDVDYDCRPPRFSSTWIRATPPARVNRCQKTRVSGPQQVSSGLGHIILIWLYSATHPFNVPSLARFPWQYQTTLARNVQVAQHDRFTSTWYHGQSRPKNVAGRLFLIDRVVRPCALGRGRQRVLEWSTTRSTARYRRNTSTSRVSIRSRLYLVSPRSERWLEWSRQSARFQRVPHRFPPQVPSRNDSQQHWFSAQQRR
jgi:hypothetical protein